MTAASQEQVDVPTMRMPPNLYPAQAPGLERIPTRMAGRPFSGSDERESSFSDAQYYEALTLIWHRLLFAAVGIYPDGVPYAYQACSDIGALKIQCHGKGDKHGNNRIGTLVELQRQI